MKSLGKSRLLSFLNNININTKLLFVAVVGAVLPMLLLVSLFTVQTYRQYEEKEQAVIDGVTDNIAVQFESAIDAVESTIFTYTTNMNLNRAMEEPDLYDQAAMALYFDDIRSKAEIDTIADPLIDDMIIYSQLEHVYSQGEFYREHQILTEEAWYSDFAKNPQYLTVVTAFEGAKPSMTILKTFNGIDFFSENLLYVEVSGEAVADLLDETLLQNFEGEVYLLNARGQVVVSTAQVYDKNSRGFVLFSDIGLEGSDEILTKEVGTGYQMNGWQLKFVLHSSTARNTVMVQIAALVLGSLLVLALLSLVNYFIAKSISNRLNHINYSMENTEGNELSKITWDMGRDEIGITAMHFNEMVQRIQDLIHVDMLTRMMNRFAIVELAEKAIREEMDHLMTGILFIDVDDFKNINDTYGHDFGDRIIVETADRLRHIIKKNIAIGRFGGDEFIVVIRHMQSIQEVEDIDYQLRKAFVEPFTVEDKEFHLTVSVGATLFPIHGDSITELIKKADMSLYKAKEVGRNCMVLYDNTMEIALEERLAFESAIKKAFEEERFYLFYQPYYNAGTGRLAGFEALIRWFSDEYGQVSPFRLISTAEETGMIIEIGHWVMAQSFAFAAEINRLSDDPVWVSVNISAIQLMHADFYEDVMVVLEKTGAKPHHITLEMTETVLIKSIENSVKTVDRLRQAGFRIAIDDFGTGYSSLAYLKRLPANQLKIDRSFVQTIDYSAFDRELVSAVTGLAHRRDMAVVAEGVETETQKESAIAFGCDLIQGYLLNKPMSREKAIVMVENRT